MRKFTFFYAVIVALICIACVIFKQTFIYYRYTSNRLCGDNGRGDSEAMIVHRLMLLARYHKTADAISQFESELNRS